MASVTLITFEDATGLSRDISVIGVPSLSLIHPYLELMALYTWANATQIIYSPNAEITYDTTVTPGHKAITYFDPPQTLDLQVQGTPQEGYPCQYLAVIEMQDRTRQVSHNGRRATTVPAPLYDIFDPSTRHIKPHIGKLITQAFSHLVDADPPLTYHRSRRIILI